jgi:deoxyribodipyrimidine photolyase
LLVTLIGCDAFVRKFTRKPKKEELTQEEMVLAPEEYKVGMSKEELYRQYFLFWKSWQDELINALSREGSHKKQVACAKEAIKNLEYLRPLLNEEKQKQLDVYINKLNALKDSVEEDAYNNNFAINASLAESIKMNILKDFSFNKIKNYLL